MNCVSFCVFLCFLWFFFGCLGAPEKRKKKQENQHFFGKNETQAADLDSLRTSGPANVSHHFLFPTSFPKESLRSEPMPGAGMRKIKLSYDLY